MSAFTAARGWCRPAGGIDYVTTKPLVWEIGAKGSGRWLTVGVGFPFQASVPAALRWLVSPHDCRILCAAALHDWCLHVEGWDRVTSAAAFHEGLRAGGVGRWKRLALTVAVLGWRWE